MLKKIIKKIFLIRQLYFKKINKDFYSQFGEDKILKELILDNFNNGFYVDVGCFHPKKHSNTYLLYKRGWSGINIDMEQDKINLFNIARPQDFNYFGAISDISKKATVYRNQKYGVSSSIKSDHINKKDIIDQSSIQTTTLNNVLANSPFEGKKIDLLNIDTEGSDFEVLQSLDFKIYDPTIIIIETHANNIDEILKSNIYTFLINKDYKLKSWCLHSLIFNKKESRK